MTARRRGQIGKLPSGRRVAGHTRPDGREHPAPGTSGSGTEQKRLTWTGVDMYPGRRVDVRRGLRRSCAPAQQLRPARADLSRGNQPPVTARSHRHWWGERHPDEGASR